MPNGGSKHEWPFIRKSRIHLPHYKHKALQLQCYSKQVHRLKTALQADIRREGYPFYAESKSKFKSGNQQANR